jgi:hypothetical protein
MHNWFPLGHQGWYVLVLAQDQTWFFVRKTGASLNFKIKLWSLHIILQKAKVKTLIFFLSHKTYPFEKKLDKYFYSMQPIKMYSP